VYQPVGLVAIRIVVFSASAYPLCEASVGILNLRSSLGRITDPRRASVGDGLGNIGEFN